MQSVFCLLLILEALSKIILVKQKVLFSIEGKQVLI
jgi:hypothetical protein